MALRLLAILVTVTGSLALSGCATIPEACRNLAGITPRFHQNDGRQFLVGYDYADEASRIRHLHCRAEQGAQDAQLELARRYEAGDGVPQDLPRAVQLYERAAAAIPPTTAIYSPPVRLGGSGRVLLINNPNAREGSAEAKYRLGRMLVEGRGVERDTRRGRSLIEDAARQGHDESGQWLRENGP